MDYLVLRCFKPHFSCVDLHNLIIEQDLGSQRCTEDSKRAPRASGDPLVALIMHRMAPEDVHDPEEDANRHLAATRGVRPT